MKHILFIHQSAELYGSDKTLLVLLKHLDVSQFKPIVVLPFNGALKSELDKIGVTTIIAPVLKLYRNMISPKNAIQFFIDKKKAIKILDDLHKQYQFDLVYSNTLAVLLGIIYAKKRKIKHLWHLHEIIESPKPINFIFKKLIAQKANTHIIYNSKATGNFWSYNATILNKSKVIWNGVAYFENKMTSATIQETRKTLYNATSDEIVIALVGRISRWKGQQVLLTAFQKLTSKYSNIKLAFIGSPPPNQNDFLMLLEKEISNHNLNNLVTIIPFQKNINSVWHTIDIAVVPSTEPEPFGLVAVEAMLAKKPVIASNHGGLSEIVVNNQTGILVQPNNETELFNAMATIIEDKNTRNQMGEKGYKRAIELFSVESYVKNFENLFLEIL